MYPILDRFEIPRASEIDFDFAEEPCGFPFVFEDSIMYDQRAFEDPGHSSITHAAVPVHYRNKWRDD